MIITFQQGCRECGIANPIRKMIDTQLTGKLGEEIYKKYKEQYFLSHKQLRDYDFAFIIQKIYERNGITCQFCSSINWAIEDIEADGIKPISNVLLSERFFYQILIENLGNEKYQVAENGSEYGPPNLKKDSINKLLKVLEVYQSSGQIKHLQSGGVFDAIISSSIHDPNLIVEKFEFLGIEYETILQVLNRLNPANPETCPKCEGTGFLKRFSWFKKGKCFKCNGTGILR